MKTFLSTFRLTALAVLLTGTVHAQLASEVTLYSFSQSIGFFIPELDYPPLVQVPGLTNDGVVFYGLMPVTGEGAGGSGIFEYANGSVSTVYTDPNSGVYEVFLGTGGSSAYASDAGVGLLALPGNTLLSTDTFLPIIQATDGTFYGFGGDPTGFYRVTSGGAALIAANPGNINQLIQATDGNFYAIGGGGFYQITQNSTETELYAFPDFSHGYAGIVEAPGSGGEFFYGFRDDGTGEPDYSGDGIIFTLTTNAGGASSTLTVLHNFAADGSEGASPNSLLMGTDGNLYGTTKGGGANFDGTFFKVTPTGELTVLYSFGEGNALPVSVAQLSDGNFYVVTTDGPGSSGESIVELILHTAFFTGETSLGNGVYYLQFPDGTPFGYYSYLTDPAYIYHFDLGYEYLFDAADGLNGVYLYDFASDDFFYTSPSFPFPYLYDFNLQSTLYYYPDTANPGHYTSDPRYFFDFATGAIISK